MPGGRVALPWQPNSGPAHAPAPVPTTAPARRVPPGRPAVVRVLYAASKSTKTAFAVVASGFVGMNTVPLLTVAGLAAAQVPRPAVPTPPGTAAPLQVRVLISATLPLTTGEIAAVVAIPARLALPIADAAPKLGPAPAGPGLPVPLPPGSPKIFPSSPLPQPAENAVRIAATSKVRALRPLPCFMSVLLSNWVGSSR